MRAYLYQVTMPHFVAGLVIECENWPLTPWRVTRSAPIIAWALGTDGQRLYDWVRRHGGDMYPIAERR
jgi:hypothetical protein